MSEPLPTPSEEQLALLSLIVRATGRSRRMTPEDAEDFEQSVQVRLVERQYDIFRRFSGRSSLRTYLTVVVKRMLLDWQNSEYGRWRPSTVAEKLGPIGVELERLIERDGFSHDEAIEVTSRRHDCTHIHLQHLIAQLPLRLPRRASPVPIVEDISGAMMFDDPIAIRERQFAEARVRTSLAWALRRLPSDDRRLIALRYGHRHSVREVAKRLRTDPKALYRRFDRVLRTLKRSLCQQGIGPLLTDVLRH
jgi:RNA polymerase sigma factor (sigma-70 family)